ncbi:MAG TPA: creatininase family protein [Solirubrobacteraceae bacterium]|jgi:creatinine amidohydrolase
MGAIDLDQLTWPQVQAEIQNGRDTVILALGATEQHGRHLPLATDALLGDHFARMLAESLDAFLAPTLRVGCSEHHLGFAGTMSLADETFHAVVGDLVRSLARGGFRRIVLIPTHGGNFAPLAAAVEKLGANPDLRIVALTDLSVLFQIAQMGESEYGVPLSEGGLHAGEWETSMLLAIHPELAQMQEAEAGFTGDLQDALARMFAGDGVAAISENGAIGDPAQASAEHGKAYWSRALELALEQIG